MALPESPILGTNRSRPPQKMSTRVTSRKTNVELGTGQECSPYLPHSGLPIFTWEQGQHSGQGPTGYGEDTLPPQGSSCHLTDNREGGEQTLHGCCCLSPGKFKVLGGCCTSVASNPSCGLAGGRSLATITGSVERGPRAVPQAES